LPLGEEYQIVFYSASFCSFLVWSGLVRFDLVAEYISEAKSH